MLQCGGFLGLFILSMYGYEKGIEITPGIVNGIKLLFSIIPAIFILICGVILLFYPVNEKLLATIEIELNERKK
jgi:GPH family glycoside/pentoside/hexuronide:cation symporter